ncbi:MAG TPA: GspE/PulE family protein [Candidatus Saccharimonadales bacterium]|nr:GspE/PulE family protein [Candidatus Saccharimonadales bacterium]
MSVLSATAQEQVEQTLVQNGSLTKPALEELKLKAKKTSTPLLGLLVTDGHVSEEELAKTIAHVTKVPYVNLDSVHIDQKTLELLPADLAERYMAVPLGEIQNRVAVAMLDADNVQAVDFLSNKIGRPLKVFAASEVGIRQVLKMYQSNISKDALAGISDIGMPTQQEQEQADKDKAKQAKPGSNIKTIVQDSPISKALSAILEFAAKNRASDVHIEPLENALRIRCRIDGVLREVMKLPKTTEPPLVSRIKILANLKIDEHRIPQDGEFTIKVLDRKIDLRIAISPVVWGEQVVIRLLDKGDTSFRLEDMGYRGRSLRAIREGLKSSNGMVLTSGPTGSGKSTSLYALLQEIKNDTINIVTLEDPVEYKMDGVNQIQVNPDVGLTFAAGLRSILRQDPNVVMVGEIRDKETAELAVQASLTGHLVFSTLHTNSAAGILPRLLDMSLEPFLIASTVHTAIGQRLVRKIGPKNETYTSDAVETDAIKETIGHLLPANDAEREKVANDLGYKTLPLRSDKAYTLCRGIDTPDSPSGYKGRLGIYEVFSITQEIQELIIKRSTSAEIQEMAQKQGMVTMREDGYLKALAGETTINEVNRVASADSA